MDNQRKRKRNQVVSSDSESDENPRKIHKHIPTDETIKKPKMYGDRNREYWKSFNTYKPPKRNSFNPSNEWISGTGVKNYLLKDPCLDYLKCLKSQTPTSNQTLIPKHNKSTQLLFNKGNIFEAEIIKLLKKKHKNNIKTVVSSFGEVEPSKMDTTFEYMKEGTPIISQAVLYNYSNRTFGIADLLVRSDYINTIFNKSILDLEEKTIQAPKLGTNYHYVVIDIKWTTMQLCSKGDLIRNNDRFRSYKGQLAIYNAALGLLQGYTPSKSYIMAKGWKKMVGKKKEEGFNSFDLLGTIDYSSFDFDFIRETWDAINWVRHVRYNWTKMGYRYDKKKPATNKELYPNMCNKFDHPYHEEKTNIANNIGEITLLWNLGVRHREIAHDKGIYRWTDDGFSPDFVGISNSKLNNILSKMIQINKQKELLMIPAVENIKDDTHNWRTGFNYLDFYIDFETLNECFHNDNINPEDSRENNGVVFMIGIGHESNGEWIYTKFSMKKYSIFEERRVIEQFISHIDGAVKNNKNNDILGVRLFHWGHAEKSFLEGAYKRHRYRKNWKIWEEKMNWIDMCKVFLDEPILIKDSMKFGLKDIAKAMKKHGMIKEEWTSGIGNGLDAMVDASLYYKSIEGGIEPDFEVIDKITKYNESDCKVLWDIVRYLRVRC